MTNTSANIYTILLFFCASFFCFSQDDGFTILKDADDKQIKFENHYFESLKYRAIGNYSRAITELEKCQQLFSDDKSVSFELSKNYFELQKYVESELYINKALKIDSENYWFLNHLKQIYLKQFHIQKAIEIQQKINIQNPKETEKLIPLYIRVKEFSKALKLLTDLESRGLKSSLFDRYRQVIENYTNRKNKKPKQVDDSKTLVELKESFKDDKKYVTLLEILNREFSSLNYDNLLIYSNQGLDLFPAQPMVYLMNGRALNHQKKYNDAIDVLINGIDFVIDDNRIKAQFHEQLAISYNGINKPKEAKKHKEKTLELKK